MAVQAAVAAGIAEYAVTWHGSAAALVGLTIVEDGAASIGFEVTAVTEPVQVGEDNTALYANELTLSSVERATMWQF